MYTDLNNKLIELKEKIWKKRKYEEHLQRATEYLKEEQQKAEKLRKQLEKEEAGVSRLERISLTSIFYTIIGKKLEKQDEAEQELLAAKLKYEEAFETIGEIKFEIERLQEKLYPVSNVEVEYKQLLLEKERLIHDTQSVWSEQLFAMAEEQADLIALLQEYKEAIVAGEKATQALSIAIASLDKAKGWSTFDMLGGGMITTAIKHSHLDDAKRHVHLAQKKLRHFQDELEDIVNHDKIVIEIGSMLTFADYFFDGLIVDWMVHGKINDSLTQVENAKNQVESLVVRLKNQQSNKKQQMEELSHLRQDMIVTVD